MNSVLLELGKRDAFGRKQTSAGELHTHARDWRRTFVSACLPDAVDTFESTRGISCSIDCERSLTTDEYQTRHAGVLKTHVLDFVLGVGFALAAHRGGRVQKAVFPDGIGSVAIERLDHLNNCTTTTR